MATRTVGSGDFIRPLRNVRTRQFLEGASQSFKKGAPLTMSGVSGYEGTHVVALAGDTITFVIGFAAEDATGTTGSPITVWLADENGEFRGVVQNTGTLDGPNVGAEYGLVADGTNVIWRVDLSDTTYKLVRITQLLDADGDVNGYVGFKCKKNGEATLVTVY
jgi:hypothetical protein